MVAAQINRPPQFIFPELGLVYFSGLGAFFSQNQLSGMNTGGLWGSIFTAIFPVGFKTGNQREAHYKTGVSGKVKNENL